ncbi:MAG: ABC transporter ATP-binding protein [Rhodospirillales bacterium]|nr:ABC transporter ATP-binding protein [Rhodospirillales bacterium]
MTELVRVEDVSVDFPSPGGTAKVLDRVNLTIGDGEIVGLVGESGCGKTTLARLILGVLPKGAAVRGTAISFSGQNVLGDRAETARRQLGFRIGFVPQEPRAALSPLFPIGVQAAEILRWSGSSGDRAGMRRRIADMFARVQLPDPHAIMHRYPHEVSGGQLQRVLIAMALLREPRLVVADEPTTALDVTIQAQILTLLRRLALEQKVAVLFTTHDLGAAWEICDRITVMYAGQEAESAAVGTFFAQPRHPYAGLLLGSMPRPGAGLPESITGAVPNLVTPPGGCRFHPRCPRALPICRAERPAPAGPAGQSVRCHNPLPERDAA